MSEAFLAHLRDLMDDMGRVTARSMFGGHGLYLDGTLIGVVIDEALYLKVDEQTRPQFEAVGSAPYVYLGQKTPITLSYWSVPESALDSPEAMRPWAQRALEAARRTADSPRRKPPSRRRN